MTKAQLMQANERLCEKSAEMEAKYKWISVKDRLPKIGRYVLVFTISGASFKGQRLHDGWSAFFKDRNGECSGIHKVTHWMPLPEPPKEEEK